MAEVAGLALSGIAFTSLVTSCIDILEYCDNGRYWIYDLGLALTKVGLLKARLGQLEKTRSTASGAGFDNNNTCHVALQGLSGVDAVLRQTNELCKRYSFLPVVDYKPIATTSSTETCQTSPSPHKRQELRAMGAQKAGRVYPGSWHRLGRRVRWVVQDKRRFDRLTSDLEELLSSIEKLVSSPRDEDADALLEIFSFTDFSSEEEARSPVHTPAQLSQKDTVAKLGIRQSQQMSPSQSSNPKHESSEVDFRTKPRPNMNTSARRTPLSTMSTPQNQDTFVGNMVQESSLSRGGIYTSDGQWVTNGTVHAERNELRGSVVVLGPQTSTDFQKGLDYLIEMRKLELSAKGSICQQR